MSSRRTLRARGRLEATRAAVLVAACAIVASGCGGSARQDAHEVTGTFQLKVLHASFPLVQSIARPTSLQLLVRNTGIHTVPNVAVTLDSFSYTEKFPELSASQRPVWIIDRGPGTLPLRPVRSQAVSPPGSGQTNYVNTWALGPLAPGGTRAFLWRVVPVKSGLHTVHFTVAAGLSGKARAVNASGEPIHGQFRAYVTPAPPPQHVNPSTGVVEPGRYPLNP